jgi:hypothetical protein
LFLKGFPLCLQLHFFFMQRAELVAQEADGSLTSEKMIG